MHAYIEEDDNYEEGPIIPLIYSDFAFVCGVGHDVGEAVDEAVEEDGC